MIDKIKEIVASYAAMVNPTDEQKRAAEVRLVSCMSCDSWKKNAVGISYCSECGCATRAKIFSPKGMNACPKGKWIV